MWPKGRDGQAILLADRHDVRTRETSHGNLTERCGRHRTSSGPELLKYYMGIRRLRSFLPFKFVSSRKKLGVMER